MYGMKYLQTLVRKRDDEAIFRGTAASVPTGVVTLTEVNWVMLKIFSSDTYKYKLYNIIESKTQINVGFRMRQCDTISLPPKYQFYMVAKCTLSSRMTSICSHWISNS